MNNRRYWLWAALILASVWLMAAIRQDADDRKARLDQSRFSHRAS